ncbi:MAG TPA: hypothetical protein VLF21_01525 [Candidatus Saccharimonadales bacterium]|nr:hypothetical protein [Candidatus Saccharimonadales bacterium]
MKNLDKKSPALIGFVQAGLVTLYVLTLVNVMSRFEHYTAHPPEVLMGAFVLISFVLSALICGTLVLGYPVLLLIQGKVKRALTVIAWSGLTFLGMMAIVFLSILA